MINVRIKIILLSIRVSLLLLLFAFNIPLRIRIIRDRYTSLHVFFHPIAHQCENIQSTSHLQSSPIFVVRDLRTHSTNNAEFNIKKNSFCSHHKLVTYSQSQIHLADKTIYTSKQQKLSYSESKRRQQRSSHTRVRRVREKPKKRKK